MQSTESTENPKGFASWFGKAMGIILILMAVFLTISAFQLSQENPSDEPSVQSNQPTQSVPQNPAQKPAPVESGMSIFK